MFCPEEDTHTHKHTQAHRKIGHSIIYGLIIVGASFEERASGLTKGQGRKTNNHAQNHKTILY